jgi:hypothetical protein
VTEDLADLADALARVSATERGLKGTAARAHVDELKARVETIRRVVDEDTDDPAVRGRAADELDKLVGTIERIDRAVGSAARKAPVFQQVDFAQIAAGMRVVAQWLRAPTPESTAAVDFLMASLRELTAAEDAATQRKLEAEIDANVDHSLAGIFGDLDDELAKH